MDTQVSWTLLIIFIKVYYIILLKAIANYSKWVRLQSLELRTKAEHGHILSAFSPYDYSV